MPYEKQIDGALVSATPLSEKEINVPFPAGFIPDFSPSPPTIALEEFVIEGRVPKPLAFMVLSRSSLGEDILQAKPSFIPKILRSVEGPPF